MRVISESVVREIVSSALFEWRESSASPIVPSNTVDKSESETDPFSDREPKDRVELVVALSRLVRGIEDEDAPRVFRAAEREVDRIRDGGEMNKIDKRNKSTKQQQAAVEEAVRRHVRAVLSEMMPPRGVDPADVDVDDDDHVHKKNAMMTDVGGSTFEEIAAELGFSIPGAKQAVDKALAKAQWVGQQLVDNPEDLEILVLTTMDEYIGVLKSSGELTDEDEALMRAHPDIVRELPGFREYLDQEVRHARA